MSLKEYKRKRDFKKTGEPAGVPSKSKTGKSYLIQKHDASRLHYDFRIELDGALKSWAVPKGPSYDPSQKRLAVHVEDHPIEYGTFEGTIPEGQYGGGTVMLWDRGTWEPIDPNPHKAYRDGKMKILLHGKKLKGGWALIRTKRPDDKGDNWLLIKERDKFAKPETDITVEAPDSVATGRTLDEIAEADDAQWDSDRAEKAARKPRGLRTTKTAATAKKKPAPVKLDTASVPEAGQKKMPGALKPQLCTLVKEVPTGETWLHEVKFDGYRIVAFVSDGEATLLSRNGKAWTSKFPDVANACAAIGHDCIVDGEIVVVRDDGTTDFQALQNFLRADKKPPVAYYIFDVMHLDGYDLTSSPLIERKRLLEKLLSKTPEDSVVRYCSHIEGGGDAVFSQACKLGMEGVISKQKSSPYLQSRGSYWVKVKCIKSQEFVIGGYTDPGGSRSEFGALLLGVYDGDALVYSGRAGTGFTEASLRDIAKELRKRGSKTTYFSNPPTGREARGVQWLKPELVCEVEFTEWTTDGQLRHPSFKGLREDKPAKSIGREHALAAAGNGSSSNKKRSHVSPKSSTQSTRRSLRNGNETSVAGVAVSNPDKELYPEGITKLEIVEYYERMADRILPYLSRRPLTLVRCPQGRAQKCFYQKHLTEGMPEHVRGVPIREKDGKAEYLVIDNKSALLELANLGVLEFHVWGAREDDVEKPDLMVFDLDPDPSVTRAALVKSVFDLRDTLTGLGLKSFLKTTGGKGFHIVVPLSRRHSWDDVKSFAQALANRMVQENPRKYTANMSKAKRLGKVYIDYLRNGRGATFIVPFSTRARPNAPVSTPLAWKELSETTDPAGWTIHTIEARLKKVKDPWRDMAGVQQSITAAMKKALGM